MFLFGNWHKKWKNSRENPAVHSIAIRTLDPSPVLIATYGHLTEQTAIVDIGVGLLTVGAPGAQTVGIVGEVPLRISEGHCGKLGAVLPHIMPSAVVAEVSTVVLDSSAIIRSQQVTPTALAVAVSYNFIRFT